MVELLVLAGAVILALMVIGFVFKVVGIVIMIGSWMAAGYLAARLVRGESYGPLQDTALGFVGAIVGGIVLGIVGLSQMGNMWLVGEVIAGVVGAVILIHAIRLVNDKKGCAGEATPKVKIKSGLETS